MRFDPAGVPMPTPTPFRAPRAAANKAAKGKDIQIVEIAEARNF